MTFTATPRQHRALSSKGGAQRRKLPYKERRRLAMIAGMANKRRWHRIKLARKEAERAASSLRGDTPV